MISELTLTPPRFASRILQFKTVPLQFVRDSVSPFTVMVPAPLPATVITGKARKADGEEIVVADVTDKGSSPEMKYWNGSQSNSISKPFRRLIR